MADPARDARGRYLPGEAWRLTHPAGVRRGPFRPPVRTHTRRCRQCSSLFLGRATQWYCSSLCKRRAHGERVRGPRSLTYEQAKDLPIFDRPRAVTDPDRPWKSGPAGKGLLVPVSGILEDRLAALLRYRLYDVDLALGGLIKLHGKERMLLGPNSEPIPATRQEMLLHDLMVWGVNAALLLLRGKKPKVEPVKMTELQRRMRGLVPNPGRSKDEESP